MRGRKGVDTILTVSLLFPWLYINVLYRSISFANIAEEAFIQSCGYVSKDDNVPSEFLLHLISHIKKTNTKKLRLDIRVIACNKLVKWII